MGRPLDIMSAVSKLLMESVLRCVFGISSKKTGELDFYENGGN
jgi:predicted transcriptional regulator